MAAACRPWFAGQHERCGMMHARFGGVSCRRNRRFIVESGKLEHDCLARRQFNRARSGSVRARLGADDDAAGAGQLDVGGRVAQARDDGVMSRAGARR
jgi:hypothetical protein